MQNELANILNRRRRKNWEDLSKQNVKTLDNVSACYNGYCVYNYMYEKFIDHILCIYTVPYLSHAYNNECATLYNKVMADTLILQSK